MDYEIDHKNKVADRLEMLAELIRVGALNVDDMEERHHVNSEHKDGAVRSTPNGKHTVTLRVSDA